MSDVEETIICRYRLLREGYFEQQKLLGPDRLIDIRYEVLDQAPIEQMRRIYDTLDLGEWEDFEPRLRRDLDSQRSYTKNPSLRCPSRFEAVCRMNGRVRSVNGLTPSEIGCGPSCCCRVGTGEFAAGLPFGYGRMTNGRRLGAP